MKCISSLTTMYIVYWVSFKQKHWITAENYPGWKITSSVQVYFEDKSLSHNSITEYKVNAFTSMNIIHLKINHKRFSCYGEENLKQMFPGIRGFVLQFIYSWPYSLRRTCFTIGFCWTVLIRTSYLWQTYNPD